MVNCSGETWYGYGYGYGYGCGCECGCGYGIGWVSTYRPATGYRVPNRHALRYEMSGVGRVSVNMEATIV